MKENELEGVAVSHMNENKTLLHCLHMNRRVTRECVTLSTHEQMCYQRVCKDAPVCGVVAV